MSVVRFLTRTAGAVRGAITTRLKGLDPRDGYCPRCDGCGEDGCCPAEICDNGPLCQQAYGTRDERNQLIGHRKGWDQCWDLYWDPYWEGYQKDEEEKQTRTQNPDELALTLNAYQAANLREAIRAVGYPYDEHLPRSPLSVLNTGDWIGEIAIMLGDFAKERRPNVPAEEMVASARRWSDR